MSYIIYTSSGTVLTTVATGKVNTSTTSLTLVGRDLLNYGRPWNQNLVYLLSNFASPNNKLPKNPILGQTWYDSTGHKLKVYNGSSFGTVGADLKISDLDPIGQDPGEFWYDPASENLNFRTNQGYITLTSFPISDVSGWKYSLTPIYDNTDNTRQLTLLKSYGQVVGTLTREAFTVSTEDSTSTFARAGTDSFSVVNGLTLINDLKFANGIVTGDLNVQGTVTAQRLVVEFTTVTTQIITTDDVIKTSNRTNATSTTTGALQIAGGAGIGRNLYIGENAYVTGTLTVGNNVVPTTTELYDLGSPTNRFRTLYISSSTISIGNGTISATPSGQISVGTLLSSGFISTNATVTNNLSVGGTITATNLVVTGASSFGTISNLLITNFTATNARITNDLSVGGYGKFAGTFDENTAAVGVYVGVAGTPPASPRIVFAAGTGTNWQVDNYNGSLRIFQSTGVAVTISGNTATLNKNLTVTSNLNVNGQIYSNGNITAYYGSPSDSRFKENIRNVEFALAKVKAINGVTFEWTDTFLSQEKQKSGFDLKKQDLGVIAQEVEAVAPRAVDTREDGFKFVKYEKLAALLIEAIKELDIKLEDIKKHIGM
jgi:hypothetical protein